MDAKPQRPIRGVQSNNENLPPKQVYQAHQPAKSIDMQSMGPPSTSTTSSNGAFKVAAKRSAFQDLSNFSRQALLEEGKSLMFKNNGSVTAASVGAQPSEANFAAMLAQENQKQVNAKEAFLQPAQRFSGLGIKGGSITHPPTISFVASKLAGGESVQQQQAIVNRYATLKRGTTIYRDAEPSTFARHADVVPELPQLLPQIPLELAIQQQQQQLQQVRHYKSTPLLKVEAQDQVLRRVKSRLPPRIHELIIDDDAAQSRYEDAVETLLADEDFVYEAYRTSSALHSEALAGERSITDVAPIGRHITQPQGVMRVKEAPAAQVHVEPEAGMGSGAGSEPEDNWDNWDEEDEEELYDEAGYTTAHSYRSLGGGLSGANTTGGATTVLIPKFTHKIRRELDAARVIVEAKQTQEEMDEDMWDISMVAEYGDEIFEYMKELEIRMLPNAHYMDIQTEIQWSMRSVLMDWLVQVHMRFSLLPETLFLAVNYIDRFLSCKIVSLGKLQLVGATAILVASKYEEINCPSVEEIVYMVDGGYTHEEILKAERYMLSLLGFELGFPGPMSFLRRISKADEYDLDTRTLAKYFLEVTIMDERFVGSPCSFLAAGAHCLARMMLNKGEWSAAHIHYSGYTLSQLKPLVHMIFDCCRMPDKHHGAVFEKYSDKKFKKMALVVQDEMRRGSQLWFHGNMAGLDEPTPPMFKPDLARTLVRAEV